MGVVYVTVKQKDLNRKYTAGKKSISTTYVVLVWYLFAQVEPKNVGVC